MKESSTKFHFFHNELIEWGLISIGLMALTITEQYHWYVTLGLILLVIAFLLRSWRVGSLVIRTGMEIPAVLFMLSAGFAAWISHDASAAWLQAARLLAGVVLYYAIAQSEETTRKKVAIGFVLAVTVLAVYWPLQHDFTSGESKFAFIDTIGVWINHYFPAIPGPSIHSNVAAGTLLLGLPFGLAAIYQSWREKRWLGVGILIFLELVILGVLLLTSSRGAWVGLGGIIFLLIMAGVQRKWFHSNTAKTIFWILSLGLTLVVLFGVVISSGVDRLLGQLPDPTGTLQGRINLWGQGLDLIHDYIYTGSGLMSFRMVYALYGIMIHVPHHDHLHNTYLEVWLEQGVIGVLALVLGLGVVLNWGRQVLVKQRVNIWVCAGLASIVAASIHGVFDVVFYVTRTLPLIGLVAGFAYQSEPVKIEHKTHPQTRNKYLLSGVALIGAIVLGLLFHRTLLASAYANLGAVLQTKMELSTYNAQNFDNPTLDMVRRRLNYSRVEKALNQSLIWDGSELTALRRLSMIDISLGKYEQSLDWAQKAWDAGYRDQITRLVYGDALTANGEAVQAANIVRGIGWAADRLAFQAWYRYWLGVPPGNVDYPRCTTAWKAVLIINPAYSGAEQALLEAEAKLQP